LIAILNKFSYAFLLVIILLLFIFIYQKKLINESKFLDAFKINNLVGIIAVLGFVLEIILLK
jgi:4-hydroxybenzoate polyprenyltransferase